MNRLELLLGLLQDNPNDAFTLFATAKEYEKLGDTDQALVYYETLHAVDPAYVGLYYHLGKLYEVKQNFEKAISIYREGMAVARKANDMHAFGELNGARLQIDEDDE